MYGLLIKVLAQLKSKLPPFVFLILFFAIQTLVFADSEPNDDCYHQENWSAFNNISGTLCEQGGGITCTRDDNDYYQISVPTTGRLDVTYTTSPTRSTDFYFSKTGCGQNRVADNQSSYTGYLDVSSGDTVYIRVLRNVNNSWTNYTINFTFTPANAKPTATVSTLTNITTAGGTTYTARVTYSDSDGTINASSIGTNDIFISGLTLTNAHIVSGSGTATTVVDYTFTPPGGAWDGSDNGTYNVSLGTGPIFDNANATITSLGGDTSFTVTIPVPTVTLTSSTTSITEASGSATLTATLSATAATSTTVTLATSGTATLNSDYTLSSSTITIAAGQLSGTTTLTAIQDTNNEGNETTIIDISGVSGGNGAKENGTQTQTITIIDETPPYANGSWRNFTLTKSENINGDIKIIGNSIMAKKNGISWICPGNTERNNNITSTYVNSDSDNSTFNSSLAQLTLPASATNKEIIWAGLYWQGYLVGQDDANKTNARHILFKTPGSSSYITLTSESSKFNWVYGRAANTTDPDRFYYQGFTNVTALVKTAGEGDYTAANIYSSTLQEYNTLTSPTLDHLGGAFGAWALVVAYKNSSATFKNISIFDGYLGISKSDKDEPGYAISTTIPLSGFLTPSSASINSTFVIFGGEGDVGATGDSVSLSNSFGNVNLTNTGTPGNPANDIFNASISLNGANVTTRTPSCQNTIGIDLDTFDVGTTGQNIIKNNQTSTNITLGSDGDGYYPGVFALATDIYQPFITINKTSNSTGTLLPNQAITYSANLKNTGNENASSIVVYDDFSDNNLTRTDGSPTDPLITLASILDQNIADINNSITCNYGPKNINCKAACTVSIPLKVSCTIPILNINETAFIEFKTKIASNPNTSGQDVNVENKMYATYKNAITGLAISQAAESNSANAGLYSGISNSLFNAWESGLSSSNPQLYTKAIGNTIAFNIGKIDGASFTGSICAQLIGGSFISAYQCLTYNNVASQTFTWSGISTADQSVYVNIKSIAVQNQVTPDGTWSDSNSTDRFAIRPDHFEFNPTILKLKAGEDYNLTVHARPVTGATDVAGYNQSKAHLTLTVDKRMPAPNDATINNALDGNLTFSANDFSFTEGNTSTMGITYNDVGIITVKLEDTNWANVDASDGTPMSDRTISGESNITFIPFDFNVSNVVIRDHNGSTFTYLASDNNMSAEISMSITARNKQGLTTLNYSDNLFEQNISMTPSIRHGGLDANITSPSNQNLDFTNGVATIAWDSNNTVKFNFDRNISIPINPFDVNGSDTNLTVIDTDAVRGDANQTATGSARFYYGRVHAPDYTFSGNHGNATIFYEVYCKDCNAITKANANIGGSESPDSINWYRNTSHINRDGNVTTFSSVGSTSINGNSYDTESSGAIATGAETKLMATATAPYNDSITMTPSPWLTFMTSTPSFTVKFLGVGQWAGQGTLGRTIDETNTSVSRKSNKRIEW